MNGCLERLDAVVWGPGLLILLTGTGAYLLLRLKLLPFRNLGRALRYALGGEARSSAKEKGRTERNGISSFSSLTTELAATIGTGNIVGVATAMLLGGPGALFWMVAGSLLGMSVKLVESSLAVKYRTTNADGERVGGPMYTCVRGLSGKRAGRLLGTLFAVFAVLASFGMGNMTQSNSIADVVFSSFGIERAKTGLVVCVLTVLAVLGGIGSIARVTQYLVPFMGVFYLLGTLLVIAGHWRSLPEVLFGIVAAAFCPQAVSGGLLGSITVNAAAAFRWGVSRGIFSNEAGLGAAGITAAAADTEDYIRQGYISMTGVFLDTVIMCTLTGLALGVSGVLGEMSSMPGVRGGAEVIMAVFRTVLGSRGDGFVCVSMVLFAFATIIGWAYQGEKAFEFLMGGQTRWNGWYRFAYGLAAYAGCILSLDTVWTFSDICNGLMAVPNLICVLLLSKGICEEVRQYG